MGMTDFVASSVMGGVILSKVGGLISKGISALKAGQGTNTVRATAKIGTNASKGSRVFEVGSYNTLRGFEAGLDAHHVGTKRIEE